MSNTAIEGVYNKSKNAHIQQHDHTSCDETDRPGHEHIEVLTVPYRMRAALGLVSPANYEQSLT